MSSLQKFHRRTNGSGPAAWPPTALGMGDATRGFWLATAGDNVSKLIIAPKTTETTLAYGTGSGNGSSLNDGLANTNSLYAAGSVGHPAAYYCKTLATGGYNTWYLPAVNELVACYSACNKAPFATADAFSSTSPYYWSSSENGNYGKYASPPQQNSWNGGKGSAKLVRAARRIP